MARILPFPARGKSAQAQPTNDFFADDGIVSFQDGPERQHTSATGDWSNQELADLYRVEALFAQANIRIETDRGVSDEGEPWFAFCRSAHDVFVHLARIDGVYLLDSPALDTVITGDDFAAIIDRFVEVVNARSSAGNIVQLRPGMRDAVVRMHPAVMLAALIWSLYLATDGHDGAAQAAQPLDLPTGESAIDIVLAAVSDTQDNDQQASEQGPTDRIADRVMDPPKLLTATDDRNTWHTAAAGAASIAASLTAIAVTYGFYSPALMPVSGAVASALQQQDSDIDLVTHDDMLALETLDPGISTLGFAGFFGMGIAHRRFGSDVVEARLPVLLRPGLFTCSGEQTPETERADRTARIAARAKRAWGRFKLAAVSSFAFVEATGPVYVGKLLRDALGLTRNAAPNDPAPRPADTIGLDQRIEMAETVLRAMSLTDRFARLVLIAGHGASVVNNPHASALHCGACGGYSGEVNARLLASLLNAPDVRTSLLARGIVVPEDTLFLAALHDTTTDDVTIYDADHSSVEHAADLTAARGWLQTAGGLARAERARRLPRAETQADIARRARDWAELRPEWALAGCQAFVAAPRWRTTGCDLGGRAFLHDYDWRRDEGFGVLELILTAPVVVASWISLQYYGSTVAPEVFGAGNKLLHNVTGGIGVVEGNGGLLRAGLPWQSVHDGNELAHEPLRLSVVIEAPQKAITGILERHADVRALLDNRWLHLFALGEDGRMAWRYAGNLSWDEAEVETLRLQAHA